MPASGPVLRPGLVKYQPRRLLGGHSSTESIQMAARISSMKVARPAFGDRIVVVYESAYGPRIKYFGYMVMEGFGAEGGGRKKTDCDEEEVSDWVTTLRANDSYCIVMVPRYVQDTGKLHWKRYSAKCCNVMFDCASIRMIDEAARDKERAQVWQNKLHWLEAGLDGDLRRRIIHSVFAEEDCHYHQPAEADLAALLVAAGIVPPVDRDAELQRIIKKELDAYNEACKTDGPVDFTG